MRCRWSRKSNTVKKTVRRSITMTQEMRDRLNLLVSKYPRDTTESDLIREAIRMYLDEQEDLISSRKHFQRSLRDRVDSLEVTLTFQLNVLIYLLATDESHLRDAIITAKQNGETLSAQIRAVRDLRSDGN